MKDLDYILANAAINAALLMIFCLTQLVNSLSNHAYWKTGLCLIGAAFCARDMAQALTYKHKEHINGTSL